MASVKIDTEGYKRYVILESAMVRLGSILIGRIVMQVAYVMANL